MQFDSITKSQLEKYCSNIIDWNEKFNLVSKSQINEIWQRHILDSAQLFEQLPNGAKKIIDFGSGAGFPAIVLATISEVKNDGKEYIMFESTTKKAKFLENCIKILGLNNAIVKNERVENCKNLKADIITARAFAKIDEIFKISKNFLTPNTKFILLKGRSVQEEIDLAKKKFNFEYQIINSKTGDGFIFVAENVKNK